MKHISSIKPTVEKGLYSLVKRPDNKAPPLSALSKTIKKFQDEPDHNFTKTLKNRIPTNSSYSKVESKNDFGLSKRVHNGILTKVETPDSSAKLISKQQANDTKSFKISKVPAFNNEYYKNIIPKTDENYTDPQFYEYKLKGKTIKNMQIDASKAEGEEDIDALDPVARYNKWKEQDELGKVEKIQSLARGRNVRLNITEGINHLDPNAPPQELSDVINVGKATRKTKSENKQLIKERAHNEEIQRKNLEAQKRENEADDAYWDAQRKEMEKRDKRTQFLEDNGILEYGKKGRETKEKQIKELNEKKNASATKLQARFRGIQERKDGKTYKNMENIPDRFKIKNPWYDPEFHDQEDNFDVYDDADAKKVTRSERRKMNHLVRKKQYEEKRRHQRENDDVENVDFIDPKPPKPPLEPERLNKAYPKKLSTQEKVTKNVRDHWIKKDEEVFKPLDEEKQAEKLTEESKDKNVEQMYRVQQQVDAFDELKGLLDSKTWGKDTKTTARMNTLIAKVYPDFGKNAGTNTNRRISEVRKIITGWAPQAESKRALVVKLDQNLIKKREKKALEKLEQAKKEEQRSVRIPPKYSNSARTLDEVVTPQSPSLFQSIANNLSPLFQQANKKAGPKTAVRQR